jgi:hypothetical protein
MAFTLAAAAIAAALSPAAQAAAPPGRGCRPASKIEYRSAKQQGLLRTMTGEYVRTGHIWRRAYWYCRR